MVPMVVVVVSRKDAVSPGPRLSTRPIAVFTGMPTPNFSQHAPHFPRPIHPTVQGQPDIILLAVSLPFLEEAGPILIHIHVALAADQTGDMPVQVR